MFKFMLSSLKTVIPNQQASFTISAGIAATLFLGYCIYFDRKRTSDPDYKKKVHLRREAQRKKRKAANEVAPLSFSTTEEAAPLSFSTKEEAAPLSFSTKEEAAPLSFSTTEEAAPLSFSTKEEAVPLPFSTTEEAERYFLSELKLTEDSLACGDSTKCIHHLSNAISISARPGKFLEDVQDLLPSNIFVDFVEHLKNNGVRFVVGVDERTSKFVSHCTDTFLVVQFSDPIDESID